jgi:hypothetical protein
MEGIGLGCLPRLRALDLSHNEIARVALPPARAGALGGAVGSGAAGGGLPLLVTLTLDGNALRALDLAPPPTPRPSPT